jgi:hypothetical protein
MKYVGVDLHKHILLAIGVGRVCPRTRSGLTSRLVAHSLSRRRRDVHHGDTPLSAAPDLIIRSS